jgi:hypothetical protein
VLRIAAAASRDVDHRLLEEVADLPAAELRDGLREAIAHQALVMTPDGRSYRFRHALVQEAVHEALLPGERSDLHAAFAAALERDPNLAAGGPDGVTRSWRTTGRPRTIWTGRSVRRWPPPRPRWASTRSPRRATTTSSRSAVGSGAADARDGHLPRYEVLRRAGRAAGLGGDHAPGVGAPP